MLDLAPLADQLTTLSDDLDRIRLGEADGGRRYLSVLASAEEALEGALEQVTAERRWHSRATR